MTSSEIVALLRSVPGPHSTEEAPSTAAADAVRAVLSPFNVFLPGEARARSESAQLFLRSLAAYIDQGMTFVDDWDRTGVRTGDLGYQHLTHGAQLLWVLEKIRTAAPDATAIRNSDIVKAVIKSEQDGELVLLTQYDNKAQAYQFVGGHIRKSDRDELAAIRREIAEELPANSFEFNGNAHIVRLGVSEADQISYTVGAFTHYRTTYFNTVFNFPLRLQQGDKWITLDDLSRGKTKDGIRINEPAFAKLLPYIPGGLAALPLSSPPQTRPLLERAKDWFDRHSGRVSLVIGVIGIFLTIIYGNCHGPVDVVPKVPPNATQPQRAP